MEDYVFSVTDGDHQAPPKVSKGIPFLVISNIADGSLDFSNTRYVPEEYYEKIQMERKPKRGDILFSVTGSYGIVVNIKTDRQFCFQRHIGLIKPTISNEYLSFVLMSNYIKSLCDKLATGTAQKTVGLDTLRSLYVPIAPIEEQERIVAKIKHLLLQISFLEAGKGKLVAAIKQAKSEILDLAIHGKLVPQDPNDEPAIELLKRINPKAEITCDTPQYGKLPKGWCETTLGNTIVIKSGDAIKVRDNRIGKYPIYGGNGITGYNESYNVDGINIIIGRVGFYCGSVHYVNNKIWVTDNAFVTKIMGNVYTPKFLYYLLQQYDLKQYSNSTAQPVISGKTVYPINVMLPPLSEQYRIVARIEELFAQLDKIESSLQA